jgi:peptidoglycan hydrolase-like protein with peptidoglycan-binding domain
MTGSTPPAGGTAGGRSAWRRRAGTAAVAAGTVAVLAVGALAALGLGGHGGDQPAVRRSGPAATVRVGRQTLVRAVTLPGALGYGTAVPITSTAAGTVTWLPEVGATVGRGEALLRVDDQPVVLLYGPLPMYRPLAEGLKGADVRQFEQNLSALGYRGFVVDDTFSADTTAAVKRWQKALKLPQSGTVDRDRVIYAAGAVRIARQLVRVGASATGEVLSYTGNTRVVTVATDRSKVAWAAPGTKVELSVSGGTPTTGEVTAVGDAGQDAAGQDVAAQDGGAAGAGGNTALVTIGFADQAALGTAAGAPVVVRYVEEEHKDVLTVPVTALLALAEGGYGVEVVADGRSRIVAVQVGLFADGRVEVSGDGLREGATVGVPG